MATAQYYYVGDFDRGANDPTNPWHGYPILRVTTPTTIPRRPRWRWTTRPTTRRSRLRFLETKSTGQRRRVFISDTTHQRAFVLRCRRTGSVRQCVWRGRGHELEYRTDYPIHTAPQLQGNAERGQSRQFRIRAGIAQPSGADESNYSKRQTNYRLRRRWNTNPQSILANVLLNATPRQIPVRGSIGVTQRVEIRQHRRFSAVVRRHQHRALVGQCLVQYHR